MAFVHLHVHSEYSLLDGACRVEELAKHAKALGQTAIAVTDHGVMYGAVAFYKEAVKAGVKPIIGCEVYVSPRSMTDKEHGFDSEYSHLVLLVKNETGYRNLCYLVSCGFTEGFYIKPRVDWELLAKHTEGLICLSGCLAGAIPKLILGGNYPGALERARMLRDMFGPDNFYLEVQDHGLDDEKRVMQALLKMSREEGFPTVLTNDAHYIKREDAYIQDVLMCVQMGKTVEDRDRLRFEGDEFFLKSEDEMRSLLPDCPEAADNTNIIADMCDFSFEFGKYHLPRFKLPDGKTDGFKYLTGLCLEGFRDRYGEGTPELKERLGYELETIKSMGFVDYFLIVSDFIAYAKGRKIPVGPGRGSAAGSIVSYSLSITDVDPVKYSLLFERFLNPERVSMPDIDIDFCVNRRGEVIDYVTDKYGADNVAQIVTFGTMAARGAIRDVGRALNISYADCDAVAKQVPFAINMKLDEALRLSKPLKEFYDNDERIKQLIDTAKAVEGMPRHASTHAAGVVVTERPLYEYVPLSKNDESVVCQYPMTTLEELGLLKMDFLGLRNLTVLEDAAALVRKTQPDFDVEKIPEDDDAVFDMLTAGQTAGVFQLESAGMTGVCVGLKPRSIEDITAIIALYRPGPMDSIPRFIECKHNPEKISYKHPLLEDILEVTYGCIVYQEQVIEIFRKLAGFSLGQADLIRRAMSKKKEKEILKERAAFVSGDNERGIDGAVSRGVPRNVAESIYDEIVDFANYAFNKSHAVAYAIVAYRTAYMKARHTQEYMAALLTSVLDSSTKVAEYIAECKAYGIKLLPPDVNESDDNFTVSGGNIRFGLAAIKNIGRGFIRELMDEREQGGPFKAFDEFCRRMCPRDLNRRAAQSLIRSGAFDSMGCKRSALLEVADSVIDGASSAQRRNIAGQLDLFGMAGEEEAGLELPDIPEFSPRELMAMEKETIGLYLTGHPMDEYASAAKKSGAVPIGTILADRDAGERFPDKTLVTVAGVAAAVKTKTTRTGSLMSYITLEDSTGSIELIAFQKSLDQGGAYVSENAALIIKGRVDLREEKDTQIIVDGIRPISDLSPLPGEKVKKEKTLYVKLESENAPAFKRIELILTMFPGDSPLVVYFADTGKRVTAPCLIHDALVRELTEMLGDKNVVVK